MPRAVRGVLVECDPSVKSIIVNINAKAQEYIIEDLDDTHLLVQENKLQDLKRILDERLRETIPENEKMSDDSD